MTAGSRVRVEVTADSRFGTNSYLVEDEETHDAVVIDSNLDPDLIIDVARRRGVNVKAILLTHTDIDHIAGLHELRQAFGPIPIAVHDAERFVLADGKPLRREFAMITTRLDGVTSFDDRYMAGSLEFEVLHTPGHSPGGVTLKIDGFLFTGDALFAGSIGRSDFANSDGEALLAGIHKELLSQADDSIVYSGHGPATTIGRERKTNPFLS
ncbi:MAG TPA: MBL fold metallo-hydrolase [Candidatus Dormibacteraeota bacterium]|nr:MBL fold metallo-hydrolase [Candidatus Dormibacteraeota bacterium]HEX2679864.1 MBL fold metallo-hydrolase [Candidatus Dormibacteraeota bacterium]